MKAIFVQLASGMAVLLVSTGLILGQSPTVLPRTSMPDGQGRRPANGSLLSTYAPTDIAASPSMASDDRRSRGRQRGQRSTSARAAMPAERALKMPRFWVQPGIGWTTVSDAGITQNEGMEERSSNTGKSGRNSPAQVMRGVSAISKSPKVMECPPMPVSQTGVPGAESDNAFSYSDHEIINGLLNSITQDDSFQSVLPANRAPGPRNSAHPKPALDIHQGF